MKGCNGTKVMALVLLCTYIASALSQHLPKYLNSEVPSLCPKLKTHVERSKKIRSYFFAKVIRAEARGARIIEIDSCIFESSMKIF